MSLVVNFEPNPKYEGTDPKGTGAKEAEIAGKKLHLQKFNWSKVWRMSKVVHQRGFKELWISMSSKIVQNF